jgi:hypothetical protein
MAALNFPQNPSDGDTYNGYVYDATAGVWNADPAQILTRFSTSSTQPSSPSEGDAWFDPSTGKTYIYYDGYWVESGNPIIGVVDLDISDINDVNLSNIQTGDALRFDGENWVNETPIKKVDNLTFTVGSSGDYQSLQTALDDVYLKYSDGATGDNFAVTLNILSGTTIEESVSMTRRNMSWVRIASEDDIVPVSAIDITNDYFFILNQSYSPTIDCLFEMDSSGDPLVLTTLGGFRLENSQIKFMTGAGFNGAYRYNIYATDGSQVFAGSGDVHFENANYNYSVYVYNGSAANIYQGVISGYHGVIVANNSNANLFGCTITANGYNATPAPIGDGIAVQDGSVVSAESAIINAADFGITVARGICFATSVNITTDADDAVIATDGSFVSVPNATLASGASYGLYADDASIITGNAITDTSALGLSSPGTYSLTSGRGLVMI